MTALTPVELRLGAFVLRPLPAVPTVFPAGREAIDVRGAMVCACVLFGGGCMGCATVKVGSVAFVAGDWRRVDERCGW